MQGNVTEWCWDWYAAYSTADQIDPQGASMGWKGRAARGGGYRDGGSDQRSATRFYGETSLTLSDLGFRVARSAL
jgi:formylglycine-generating enzyme required for sulfatase activity